MTSSVTLLTFNMTSNLTFDMNFGEIKLRKKIHDFFVGGTKGKNPKKNLISPKSALVFEKKQEI